MSKAPEKTNKEEEKAEEKLPRKIDIRSALALIPPAAQLFGKKKTVRERRVRIRFKPNVKEGIALLNPELAKDLNITEYLEIVVAGRRRFRFKAEVSDEVPLNEVWVNGKDLPEKGVADNSIATVRAVRP